MRWNVRVAALPWNGWQLCRGISGRIPTESVAAFAWNTQGYVGFFQFLRNFRQQNAFEQAGLILRAALDPTIAWKARRENS